MNEQYRPYKAQRNICSEIKRYKLTSITKLGFIKWIKGIHIKLPKARTTYAITKEMIENENNFSFDSVLLETAYSCIFDWNAAKGILDIEETKVAICNDIP